MEEDSDTDMTHIEEHTDMQVLDAELHCEHVYSR